ncbi:hypothetical protein [Streptomyces sp. NRRL F-5065]|uniref:hypothetical protein n=1 Tax=Streptomyces sp. NRRL F-5065 TaxID=1463855 RepID=UPI00131AB2DA|nr:hypothetical protein [Streptomyces sp. NRRL F-5065]
MTVMRDAAGVTRGAGYAGWPLLPSPPVGESQPRSAAVPPVPAAVPAAAPAQEVDDLVAVAAVLNDGDRIVYIDRRPDRAA